jgi:hypothetical protein
MEGVPGPSVQTCLDAANRKALARLVVLYTWTRNTDFKSEHLIATSGPQVEVLGIDHGHCFDYQWGLDIRDRAGSVPLVLAEPLQGIVREEEIMQGLARLDSLSEDQIRGTLEDVPAEWGISAEELDALAGYLVSSVARVRQVVEDRFRLKEANT